MRHQVIRKKQHYQYLVRCMYQRREATGRGKCQDDRDSVAVELVYSVYSIIGKSIKTNYPIFIFANMPHLLKVASAINLAFSTLCRPIKLTTHVA
jgi:hypothetical protein